MMWQRARILGTRKSPEVVGRLVWVQMGPPSIGRDTEARAMRIGYRTNLIDGFFFCAFEAHNIELLPEFADNIPVEDWNDFLRGEG